MNNFLSSADSLSPKFVQLAWPLLQEFSACIDESQVNYELPVLIFQGTVKL